MSLTPPSPLEPQNTASGPGSPCSNLPHSLGWVSWWGYPPPPHTHFCSALMAPPPHTHTRTRDHTTHCCSLCTSSHGKPVLLDSPSVWSADFLGTFSTLPPVGPLPETKVLLLQRHPLSQNPQGCMHHKIEQTEPCNEVGLCQGSIMLFVAFFVPPFSDWCTIHHMWTMHSAAQA